MALLRAGLIGCACLLLVACSGPESTTATTAQTTASGDQSLTGHNLATDETDQTIVRAGGSDVRTAGGRGAVPGELLVKFRPNTTKTGISTALNKVSVQGVRAYGAISNLRRVRVAPGVSVDEAMEAYRNDPAVEYAEPNYIYRKAAIPNDPRFSEQWGLHNTGQTGGITDADIDAAEAWDITTGSDSVVIAVLDTGVDYAHEDLAPNIFTNSAECDHDGVDDDANGYIDDCHGIDAVGDDSDPADDEGHGTHVAGILGAVGGNGIGIAGVAWNVRILPCKFISAQGTGTTADAIECLDYIALMKDRGVNIVATNNSWAGYDDSLALRDAIVAQRDRGILFVAAAGNSAHDNDFFPVYPCSTDSSNVICVANYTNLGLPSYSTNMGNHGVHVGAPGEAILSTLPDDAYGLSSGTSMAAPYVSGVIALLATQNPARTWIQNRNLVLSSGSQNSGYDPIIRTVTKRQVNALSALTCNNSVVKSRVNPRFADRELHRAGEPLTLAVTHINCADPAGPTTAQISPGNATIMLVDDASAVDAVAGDGIYSASWTPTVAGPHTLTFPGTMPGTLTATLMVDEHLKPGFPVKTLRTGGSYSPPLYTTVGDLTGDGRAEIIATGLSSGPVQVWHYDGTLAAGWPRMDPYGDYEMLGAGYPVLAQLDAATSQRELFVSYYGGTVAGYTPGATLLPGWPRTLQSLFGLERRPVAVDLTGDGIDEIFIYDNSDMNVLRHDGGTVPGWLPFDGTPPAIGDLDGDMEVEIVWVRIVSNGVLELHAAHTDGSELPGFPFIDDSLTTEPMIGDIDADGRNEIVFASSAGVFKVASSAAITQVVPSIHPTYLIDFSHAAALGDLDGDGVPEIVFAATHRPGVGYNQVTAFAWHGNGAVVQGFPTDLGEPLSMDASGPVIADVDSDGSADIVLATQYDGIINGLLFAVDNAGATLDGFPKRFSMGGGTVPAVADLDSNGHNDIVIAGSGWSGVAGAFDGVWAFEVTGPVQNGPIEWSQFAGDARHHNYYDLGKNLPAHAFVAAHVRGSGSIAALGLSCGMDCVERVAKGASVTFTATAAPGSAFSRWRGACSGQPATCVISIQRYTSVVAEFSTGPTLTVTTSGTGSGRVTDDTGAIACPGTCSQGYLTGAVVVLTAAAEPDSVFTGWSGACSGSSPTCQVTVNQARSVNAAFARSSRALTVSRLGTGVGRVSSNPEGIDCGSDCDESFPHGTTITLTASADPGSSFTGWSGACSGSSASCTVTLNGSTSVTATYAKRPTLTTTVSGAGSGSISSNPAGISCGADCTEIYDTGTALTLTATPAAGSEFEGWSGACGTQSLTCNVTMDSDKTVTALFRTAPPAGNPSGGGSGGSGGGGGGSTSLLTLLLGAMLVAARLRRSHSNRQR